MRTKAYPFFGCERYKKKQIKTMHTLFIDVYYGCVCECVQDVCLRSSSTFVHRFGGISSDTGLKFEAVFKVCRCFLTCITRSHVCHSESSAGEREREHALGTPQYHKAYRITTFPPSGPEAGLYYPYLSSLLGFVGISMPKIRRRL